MKAKRELEILNYINKIEVCSYDDICKKFNISISTARRDINSLAKEKHIKKVHGGFVPFAYTSLPKNKKLQKNIQAENVVSSRFDHIGKIAASLVKAGDIIYIGSGTTTSTILNHLNNISDLIIVTNNLFIATSSLKFSNEIILIGGRINSHSMSTVGVSVIDDISNMNILKAFIGCNGISSKNGFSNLENDEAYIKKAILKSTKEIYIMADNSKFDAISLHTFASFQDVDGIITDTEPNDSYKKICEENHVKLLY